MSREKINAEITEALGQVPMFLRQIPDTAIEAEWKLFKRTVLSDKTAIPAKYKELIGVAIAAATHCWYCSNFHTGFASIHGATPEEIQEATSIAKFSTGWSSYFNGTLYNKELFMRQLHEIGNYIGREKQSLEEVLN